MNNILIYKYISVYIYDLYTLYTKMSMKLSNDDVKEATALSGRT